MFTRGAQHSLQRGSGKLICTVDVKNQKLLSLVFVDSDCIWIKREILQLQKLYLKVKVFKGAICRNLKARQEIWGLGLITRQNYIA